MLSRDLATAGLRAILSCLYNIHYLANDDAMRLSSLDLCFRIPASAVE